VGQIYLILCCKINLSRFSRLELDKCSIGVDEQFTRTRVNCSKTSYTSRRLRMPFELHEVHPIVGFVVVLLTVIAYRFIPPDKTINYRLLIPLAGTLKRGDEPPIEVHVRIAMMVLVSIIVLISSLYTILSGTYPDATQKLAYGSVGTILGFWLKK
jgi:hypothetical protein